jgi:tetratricopeptide (TPR) repeat protein/TolB-like protein/tRNA A-37 threonylcarbamoyl transferase component Bud32
MPEAQGAIPDNAAVLPDLSGKMVGRFAVRARLGKGGMGEVYRADDTKLKRSVALKRIAPSLRADDRYRQRFLREAEHASRLNDQRIAAIYEWLEERDETFLVMEYVEGSTLRQRLAKPLSLEEFLPLAVECAEALAAAHAKDVVHRDIKPENIMLTPKGGVKILDFGLAKRLPSADDATTTATAGSSELSISGTPAYMAPEVWLAKPSDARADIFSLGVVFYEMLSGQHPFGGESYVATTYRILHETPQPITRLNPTVPANLERIISRMLAKQPDKRYANAAALVADLRAVAGGATAAPLPSSAVRRPAYPRVAAVIAALVVIATLVLLAAVPGLQRGLKRRLGFVEVPEQKHVVVLPFSVPGGSGEAAAFCKGLTETVNVGLTRLTERHSLQVVPASEVRSQGVTTIDQARREFGANLVIEGSLQIAADRDRVTYAVVDANTHRVLHADTITAGAANPFAVEDQVVASVVDALEITLQPRERSALAAHGTSEPAAYDSYLRGRGYLQDYPKPENVESAIAAFKRALEKDPRYALAYAGVGEAYWYKYEHTKEPQWMEQALAACERAVALRSDLSDGHTCLGVVYNGTGRHELAAEQFRQAVEREPTSDAAYRGLAFAYERLGRPKAAEETYRRAIALRPHYWAGYSWLGVFYYFQARYAAAAEMFNQVVKLAPDSFRGYSNLCAAYTSQGRYAEAIQACERSAAIRPNASAYSDLGTAQFYLKRFAEAAKAYEKAVSLERQEYLWWGNLGDARYWAPGQRADATSAYQQAASLAQKDLRVNPRDARALGYLAYYYAMLENKEAALSSIQQALTLAPDNAEIRFNTALIHNKLGQVNQALEWLEKALVVGWNPATVRDNPFLDNLRTDPRYLQLFQGHQP